MCVEIEFSFGAGKGGRTATKVGLAGISQVGVASNKFGFNVALKKAV